MVLSIAFAWPQAWRAARADDVSGISAPTTLLLICTSTTWLLYGLAVADASLIAGNGVTMLAAMLTLAVVLRRSVERPAALAPLLVAWLAVLTIVALVAGALDLGPAPVGVLGAVLGVTMSIPQAWRITRGHGTEGVSLATYVLLMAVMTSWLVYGLLLGDPVVWSPNVFGLVVVGAVVAAIVVHRSPADRLEPARA